MNGDNSLWGTPVCVRSRYLGCRWHGHWRYPIESPSSNHRWPPQSFLAWRDSSLGCSTYVCYRRSTVVLTCSSRRQSHSPPSYGAPTYRQDQIGLPHVWIDYWIFAVEGECFLEILQTLIQTIHTAFTTPSVMNVHWVCGIKINRNVEITTRLIKLAQLIEDESPSVVGWCILIIDLQSSMMGIR